MPASRIFADEIAARSRLYDLGLDRQDLIEIALLAASARSEQTPYDPYGSGGQFSYIHGTRHIRMKLCPKGWTVHREGNVEATKHPTLGLKIVFQNADSACDPTRCPQPVTAKGRSTREQVDMVSGELFDAAELDDLMKNADVDDAALWFFCVATVEDEPVAELFCPSGIVDGRFGGYHERIFILQRGDLDATALDEDDPDEGTGDIDVPVSKK